MICCFFLLKIEICKFMESTAILIILVLNSILLIVIFIVMIRFVVNKFKEQLEDTNDRLKDIEDKYNKLDIQFSRISALHVSHQKTDMAKDLEKVKLVIQDMSKKTEKIYKRTEKLYSKK